MQQSPDTFSINGATVRQSPSDGVFLLDTYNHRSYLPVSTLLKSAGATLTQTLKPDGSSNWDFSLSGSMDGVAGAVIIRPIEINYGSDGLLSIESRVVSQKAENPLTVVIDDVKGRDASKEFLPDKNYVMFVLDGRTVIIDALGGIHHVKTFG